MEGVLWFIPTCLITGNPDKRISLISFKTSVKSVWPMHLYFVYTLFKIIHIPRIFQLFPSAYCIVPATSYFSFISLTMIDDKSGSSCFFIENIVFYFKFQTITFFFVHISINIELIRQRI